MMRRGICAMGRGGLRVSRFEVLGSGGSFGLHEMWSFWFVENGAMAFAGNAHDGVWILDVDCRHSPWCGCVDGCTFPRRRVEPVIISQRTPTKQLPAR